METLNYKFRKKSVEMMKNIFAFYCVKHKNTLCFSLIMNACMNFLIYNLAMMIYNYLWYAKIRTETDGLYM